MDAKISMIIALSMQNSIELMADLFYTQAIDRTDMYKANSLTSQNVTNVDNEMSVFTLLKYKKK